MILGNPTKDEKYKNGEFMTEEEFKKLLDHKYDRLIARLFEEVVLSDESVVGDQQLQEDDTILYFKKDEPKKMLFLKFIK